ncbi:MAG: LysE family transporter [Bacteroidales bacterium]|nr:LysE family transporter [Bacteroidales bacterium]
MGIFLLGILGGIALSLFFSFGPAFFSQVQASIHYGFRNAVPFAFGVSTSDILVVAILLLISRNIPMDEMLAILSNRWIISIGAIIIASFGLYTMFLKTKHAAESSETDRINFQTVQMPSRISVYLRGMTLNFFNPLIWVYWATMVTILICGESDITIGQRYLFFAGVLSATLSMDILKCKLASLLQRIITYRFLKIFNKSVGLILIGFAVFMVVSTMPRFKGQNNNQKSIEMMHEIMHTKPPKIK